MNRLRRAFVLAVGGAIALHAAARETAPALAVPYYTPAAFMQGVHRHWYAPRAQAFTASADALARALEHLCSAPAAQAQAGLRLARRHWQAAVLAWDTLSAVAVGPLLQRRSARHIDFSPPRPELIARVLRSPPADLKALERVGAPARGFPALEWLLWKAPMGSGSPACAHGLLLGLEIEAEAQALAAAFDELARRDWAADEAAAVAAMSELVNQWVGGLERLRWAGIEKPLRSARGGKAPAYPRAASGSTLRSWQAQWQGLQSVAVASAGPAPAAGAGLVPLETYLRGRGLNPLADKLESASDQVGRQLEAANPAQAASALSAARALAGMKRLAEAEIAPALEVQIGFSDSDGD